MSLNSLLQSPDASQRTVVKEHVAKWEKTGLLEGLGNETEKAGMATLLENQARELIKIDNLLNKAQANLGVQKRISQAGRKRREAAAGRYYR